MHMHRDESRNKQELPAWIVKHAGEPPHELSREFYTTSYSFLNCLSRDVYSHECHPLIRNIFSSFSLKYLYKYINII